MTTTKPPGTTTTVRGPLSDYSGLVPLLTTFTPPDSCKNNWVYDVETEGTVWKDHHYNTNYPIDCQPFYGQNSVYRPGICPSGQEFKSLDVTVESGGDSSSQAPSWYKGYCCSTTTINLSIFSCSGYKLSYRERFSQYPECFSGLVPPVIATVTDERATDGDTAAPSTMTIGSALVGIEEPVQIVWAESDLTYFQAPVANSFRALMGLAPLATTTTTGSMASATSNTLGFPVITSTTSPEDPGDDDEVASTSTNSLSGGAIAGVSIGAVVFLVLLISSFYLAFCRRRRKRRAQQNSETFENTGSGDDAPFKKRGQTGWWRSWKKKEVVFKGDGDERRNGGNEAWMPELQDTQMGSRVDPYYLSQRHGELQGTTVGTHPHRPVELESRPLGNSGLGGRNQETP
ncbi:hypothetical protein F5Y13DRAFT_198777 [Hypoxylon sp. FL1857]|nr:hypothetical protein F5Y13DRAFT_198777 [Hypoxylon sp. FL1857]